MSCPTPVAPVIILTGSAMDMCRRYMSSLDVRCDDLLVRVEPPFLYLIRSAHSPIFSDRVGFFVAVHPHGIPDVIAPYTGLIKGADLGRAPLGSAQSIEVDSTSGVWRIISPVMCVDIPFLPTLLESDHLCPIPNHPLNPPLPSFTIDHAEMMDISAELYGMKNIALCFTANHYQYEFVGIKEGVDLCITSVREEPVTHRFHIRARDLKKLEFWLVRSPLVFTYLSAHRLVISQCQQHVVLYVRHDRPLSNIRCLGQDGAPTPFQHPV